MSGFDSVGGSSLAIPVDSGGLEQNNNRKERTEQQQRKERTTTERVELILEGLIYDYRFSALIHRTPFLKLLEPNSCHTRGGMGVAARATGPRRSPSSQDRGGAHVTPQVSP